MADPVTISPALVDALDEYERLYLTGRNAAALTRRAYLTDLRELLTHLTTIGIATPGQVERKHLEGFVSTLDGLQRAGTTRRRKVASIRTFFTFLFDQGIIPDNPTKKLIPPSAEHNQPRVLSEGEYENLRAAAAYNVRDLAIIELLLQTGMRRAELTTLKVTDIALPARITKDPGNVGSVTIHGKGRRTRTVTLNWKACAALKSYLAVRTKKESESPALFLTKFAKGIGTRSVNNLIVKYLGEAHIPNATVHTLRHTFATHSVKKGTKLDVVRKALGHSSLATTSIYVDLAREVMDEEMQKNAL